MKNLIQLSENVRSINQNIQYMFGVFSTLRIKEYDMVEVTGENGRKFKGFFKKLESSIYRDRMYLGIYLYRIKKNGEASKVCTYIIDPINIVKL